MGLSSFFQLENYIDFCIGNNHDDDDNADR